MSKPSGFVIQGHFNDSVSWDSAKRSAVSVRDGVLHYLGGEIGMEPAEQMFTVYRSPATIANAASVMAGVLLTDGHVDLDQPVADSFGVVRSSVMIDLIDEETSSTLAVKHDVEVDDRLKATLASGICELSLGYRAELVPHHKWDFEQRDIVPHHLAVVGSGRCGASCTFVDRKPLTEDDQMAIKTKTAPKKNALAATIASVFCDEEGNPNLEQIVEIAMKLPEALKTLPMDKLQEVLPVLQAIVNGSAAAADPDAAAEEDLDGDGETETLDEDGEPKEKAPAAETKKLADSSAFRDAVAAATAGAVKEFAVVAEKAKQFLDDGYDITNKSARDLMRAALKTQTSEKFSDSELPLAFKLLKAPAKTYQNFGDSSTLNGKFDSIADKEL